MLPRVVEAAMFPASMRPGRSPSGPGFGAPVEAFPESMRRAASGGMGIEPGGDGGADEEMRRLQAMHRFDGTKRMLLPHDQQFATRFGSGVGVYWSRFDEATRDNWTNALAMRRSSFIHEILRHRQLPVVSLPWHIEVDDPKDPDQAKVAERITKLIEAIPRFAALRLYLSEDKWQGKYGSQIRWGKVRIDGRPQVTIVDHEPVDGDSIVYKYDKTPGILVRSGWAPSSEHDGKYVEEPGDAWVQLADRGRAIFLHDQFWRDHFIISNFEPSSADFLFEGDKAGGIFGVGFRSRLYWDYQFREELRTWRADALQRIGVNGMLYGFYQSGNAASMTQVINALKLIIRDNVTAFPVEKDAEPQEIRHIEPSQVGYDVIDSCVGELEDSMRRAVLGQSLSSEAQSTGLGSEVAELHRSTFEHIIRYDASCQQETLTTDVIGPIVRFNEWEYRGQTLKGELPFRCRLLYSIDKANVAERAQVITSAYNIGLPLDSEAVYSDLGLQAPKDPANTLKKPDAQPAPGAPGQGPPGMPPGGGEPAPGKTSVAPGFRIVRHPDGAVKVHALPKPEPTPAPAPSPAPAPAPPAPAPVPARRSA